MTSFTSSRVATYFEEDSRVFGIKGNYIDPGDWRNTVCEGVFKFIAA